MGDVSVAETSSNGASSTSKRARLGADSNGQANGGHGNKVTVVLGAQGGDEGKGKVVDLLAVDADIVARCQVHNHSLSALSFFFKPLVSTEVYPCVLTE